MKVLTYCFVALMLALGIGLQTGCEDAKGIEGLIVTDASGQTVVELASDELEVALTVTLSKTNNLALPLEWSVSNPALGSIASQSGYAAVYRRSSATGNNVVTAKDQYDNSGSATIVQQ